MEDIQNFNNNGSDLIATTDEEKQIALFKSMYYQMNAKPDSMSKAFSKKVIISREDIIDLNKRVLQKISTQYKEDGYKVTILASLSNKQTVNFECWEEFIKYEWTETSYINSVTLKWNFNIRVPQYELPQNHTLMVKLSNGLRPEEMLNMIFSGNIEDFDDVETNCYPIITRVDFISPLFGEELLNIVEKWAEGLTKERDRKNPFLLFLAKYRKKVSYYFNYLAFIMLIILGIAVIDKIILSFDVKKIVEMTTKQFMTIFNSICIFVIIVFVSLKILDRIASKIYETLLEYGKGFIFSITKGDYKKQSELQEEDKKSCKKIVVNIIISLIFNVLCGIIATLLLK